MCIYITDLYNSDTYICVYITVIYIMTYMCVYIYVCIYVYIFFPIYTKRNPITYQEVKCELKPNQTSTDSR